VRYNYTDFSTPALCKSDTKNWRLCTIHNSYQHTKQVGGTAAPHIRIQEVLDSILGRIIEDSEIFRGL
jgi:hypothetical protein